MFTGIIEEMGTISSIVLGSLSAVITIQASKVLEGSQVGDSIAVNGVCLTVTSIHGGLFTADVWLKPCAGVHLEACQKEAG